MVLTNAYLSSYFGALQNTSDSHCDVTARSPGRPTTRPSLCPPTPPLRLCPAANDPGLGEGRRPQLPGRWLHLARHRVRRVLHLQLVRAQRHRRYRAQHKHDHRRCLLRVRTRRCGAVIDVWYGWYAAVQAEKTRKFVLKKPIRRLFNAQRLIIVE